MFHAITLRLPPDFQRRGPGFPGSRSSQGGGQSARARDGTEPGDPFIVGLGSVRPHPEPDVRTDVIGGQLALT